MTIQIIIGIAFCFQLVLNSTRPAISLYAAHLGASPLDIGLLTATFAFLPLFLAIYAGRIADQIGNRIPIALGLVGTAAGMGIPFYYSALWALYASQIIISIAHTFMVISLQNVIGNEAPEHKRDYYFSMLSTAVSITVMLGPVLCGYLIEHSGYSSVFLFSLFLCVPPLLIFVKIPGGANHGNTQREKLSTSIGLIKIPELRRALIASALALYSRDIFVAYFPLYADGIGMSASGIGWILSIQGLMMVVTRLFLTRLTICFGRERVLMGSIIVAGLSFLFIPFSHDAVLLGVFAAIMGAGLGCGQPLSMTTTYNASPKSKTGEALGLRLMFNRLSQLIAPLFFGVIGASLGLISVFVFSGAFLLAGTFAIRPRPIRLQSGLSDFNKPPSK